MLDDKLKFYKLDSIKNLIIVRSALIVLYVIAIIVFLYAIFLVILKSDYNSLKKEIEQVIMSGYESVYDYQLSSNFNDEIQKVPSWHHYNPFSKSIEDLAVLYDKEYYNDPVALFSFSHLPFTIVKLNKNKDHYIWTKYTPIGVLYDDNYNVALLYNPVSQVYRKTFDLIMKDDLSDSQKLYNGFEEIDKISPPKMYASSEYNNVHKVSLFHVLDLYTIGEGVGKNYRGEATIGSAQVYYKIETIYLKIRRNYGYCFIFSDTFNITIICMLIAICISVALFIWLYFIPKCKTRYFLAGKIWENVTGNDAIIFKYTITGRNTLIRITSGGEEAYCFEFSKDRTLLKLSDGSIKHIEYISNTKIEFDGTEYNDCTNIIR